MNSRAMRLLLSSLHNQMQDAQSHSAIGTVCRKLSPVLLCLVIWSVGSNLVAVAGFAATPSLPPCAKDEYRQLDFWLGDWDVSDFDNPTVINARVRVDRILDGCVLHEDYQDTTGAKGESFSIYDATTNAWYQSWVTNQGRLLLLKGGLTQDGMVLTGEDRTPDGKKRIVRGTWKPMKDGVRETAVVSLDDGRSWTPWFDLVFHPHLSRPDKPNK